MKPKTEFERSRAMCDYSLEACKKRTARAGETIATQRFPGGSLGFAAPENNTVAVCLACDTKLELNNLPTAIQSMCGTRESALAIFTQRDTTVDRDAVIFQNGQTATLQQLGCGVSARVVDDLSQSSGNSRQPPINRFSESDQTIKRCIRETVSNLLDD